MSGKSWAMNGGAVIMILVAVAAVHLISRPEVPYDLQTIIKSEALRHNPKDRPDGKIVIVNFWASWCPPCIEETPSMLDFAKRNQGKLSLFSVSQDSSKKEIEDFLKGFPGLGESNVHLIWDADRSKASQFKVYKLPETFVFSRQGKMIRQLSGAMDWSAPELQALIDSN